MKRMNDCNTTLCLDHNTNSPVVLTPSITVMSLIVGHLYLIHNEGIMSWQDMVSSCTHTDSNLKYTILRTVTGTAAQMVHVNNSTKSKY